VQVLAIDEALIQLALFVGVGVVIGLLAIVNRGKGPIRISRTISVKGPVEMHAGHPVLTEEMREKLQRQGIDPAEIQAQLESGGAKVVSHSYLTLSENGVTGSFEIKGGRPVLTDASRAELERQGVDTAAFEARAGERFSIEGDGDLVIHHPEVSPGAPKPGAGAESWTTRWGTGELPTEAKDEPEPPLYRKAKREDF
jgi:hypothetical protein